MPTKLIPSFLSLRLKSRLIATIVGSEAPWNLPSIATPRIPMTKSWPALVTLSSRQKPKKIGLTLMLTVKWTDEAKTGLYTLLAFIAERNPLAAEALLQRIEEPVIPLAEHPYLFRPQGERDS